MREVTKIFLEETGAAKKQRTQFMAVAEQFQNQMAPEEYAVWIEASEKVGEDMVRDYGEAIEKLVTDEDMNAVIEFQRSSVGRKMADVEPFVSAFVKGNVQKYTNQVLQVMNGLREVKMARMQQEMLANQNLTKALSAETEKVVSTTPDVPVPAKPAKKGKKLKVVN